MYTVIGILIVVSGYLALNSLILFTEDFAYECDELAFGMAMVNIILGIIIILGGTMVNSAALLIGTILAALAVLEFISVKIHEGIGYKWLKAYKDAKVTYEPIAPAAMKGRDKNSYDDTFDDESEDPWG